MRRQSRKPGNGAASLCKGSIGARKWRPAWPVDPQAHGLRIDSWWRGKCGSQLPRRPMRESRASPTGFVRRRPLPQAMGLERCSLAAGRRDSIVGVFLIWIARNPLKSPESDEGIQENPSPFSWAGLVWLWFGLEEFGLRALREA